MSNQQSLALNDETWRIPHWCDALGHMKNVQVRRLVMSHAGLIRRAQMDGIENVAPVLLALRCAPDEARRRVGKSVWRDVHHSPLSLNVARANVMLRTTIRLADLVRFPPGALREVASNVRVRGLDAVIAAGLVARTRTEFREAVMLAYDARRMGGTVDPGWSMRRLREEHDRRAMEWARAKSDPTPWADPWAETMDGYTFTLLNSAAAFAAEGATMRHCVASYASDAKAGKYIIMHIDGKERATVRFGGHPVRVQEVRGRMNAAVSEACRRACAKVCAEHLESAPRKPA